MGGGGTQVPELCMEARRQPASVGPPSLSHGSQGLNREPQDQRQVTPLLTCLLSVLLGFSRVMAGAGRMAQPSRAHNACRGPGLNSQHSHRATHIFLLTPVPGDALSGLCRYLHSPLPRTHARMHTHFKRLKS